MLDLAPETRRRRIGLTPMIDVVFLLLVFFMLAARFGTTDAIPVTLTAGGTADYQGPPRLVTVLTDSIRVNGIEVSNPVNALSPLMTQDSDIIILRPSEDASVQHLLDAMTTLRAAGWSNLVVLE
ncbi:ExbD/TolR family protein [Marivita hallyeonensis]|uniref:Biopolymer transport protein ExbD n=1 Tax=Marivita hallyeonensis TaxID=996342 RepID=A0A1M5PAW1_9RHOB|nr:biopolymer transporter ExbD [Marivita hallyeonensis]SHG98579.1 biopolymer transport protein ExbD [Marivita hallyeonensis]